MKRSSIYGAMVNGIYQLDGGQKSLVNGCFHRVQIPTKMNWGAPPVLRMRQDPKSWCAPRLSKMSKFHQSILFVVFKHRRRFSESTVDET